MKSEKLPIVINSRRIIELSDLPEKIKSRNDIVSKGWSILDFLKNDFNKDGLLDIVGVIDHPINDKVMYPRILFIYFNLKIFFNIKLN